MGLYKQILYTKKKEIEMYFAKNWFLKNQTEK